METAATFASEVFEPQQRAIYTYEVGILEDPDLHDQDPLQEFLAKTAARRRLKFSIARKVDFRVNELRIEAQTEGEPFSETSAADLQEFIHVAGPTKQPGLFCLDNGNLRALWRSGHEQVGLQFLGEQRVQFVIFAQREAPEMMMRIVGIDTLGNMAARIERDRIDHLLVG
jgi:hypothetical protein